MEVTVAMPTIPTRIHSGMFKRALLSVTRQTFSASVSVAVDIQRVGAPKNRQRALEAVQTPWTAFLDDDDEFMPQHLERLLAHAQETGADYVYSWFEVIGGTDPFPMNFGKPFDPENPVETTITTLVRTELAKEVGFLPTQRFDGAQWWEDRRFTLDCIEAGAKISHLPEKTWLWHHHSNNTMGRPDRW